MPLSLWRLSWREWTHHPWRHGMALLAVALGVALAWSVHLINTSALAEFSSAVRAANGDPDLSLRSPREGFDDAWFDTVASAPGVALASPLLEVDSYAKAADGQRVVLKLLGIDALSIAAMAPTLLPRPGGDARNFAALDPDAVFLNARARELLGVADGSVLEVQSGPRWLRLRVSGSIAAPGAALAVLDIAGAQTHFGLDGRLTRIDIRMTGGHTTEQLLANSTLPPTVQALPADDAEQRMSNLSRAYRVNLTVLALVALFVGAFLVFSVVSLSLAQRLPAFALLGVLGLTARERRALVLGECALLGLVGSLVGLFLGALLATLALRWLAGDLGGGFFPGIAPALHIDALAASGFAALGTACAVVGGWLPARRAEAMSPAQALKGLGDAHAQAAPAWPALLLLAIGVALAFVPPLGGLPVAAYLSVAALLFGGVALVPAVVQALLSLLPATQDALLLLAVQRARFQRHTASAAVAGVVASLALSVALTVMVTSFRGGVADWLDKVLPADLYVRSAGSSSTTDQAWFDEAFVAEVAALPGVQRVSASRLRALSLAPGRPAVTLIARALGEPAETLPLLQSPLAPRDGETGVYLSEAAAALYELRQGDEMRLPVAGVGPFTQNPPAIGMPVRVLGIWRDYARQFGAIAIDAEAYRAWTGDRRLNDLALWLAPGTDSGGLQQRMRTLSGDPALLDFAATPELRALSLAIFDRSFAVTYYLQAVAIAIGLVGVAASMSAQVLARRKEFGLLSHLGLTRGQVIGVVAGEGAAWLAAGTLIGLLLGLAVSVVLVHVVNPQSFHWTMQLLLPWRPLLALCAAVLAAGIGTAALSARSAASRTALLSVKEDW
jgi:putative ABC transport system permease protein